MSNDPKVTIVAVGLMALTVLLIVLVVRRWMNRKGRRTRKQFRSAHEFTPSHTFVDPRSGTGVAIDPAARLLALPGRRRPITFSFDQIVSVEVERDGVAIQSTDRKSQFAGAAVGAVLLGPLGLLLGGLTGSRRQSERVKRLALKIYTNDLAYPVGSVIFFDRKDAVAATDAKLTRAAEILDQWHARLQVALAGQHGSRSAAR